MGRGDTRVLNRVFLHFSCISTFFFIASDGSIWRFAQPFSLVVKNERFFTWMQFQETGKYFSIMRDGEREARVDALVI